jgi:ubiquinone/menaquinone biosynthesis C-methylase UbiE
MRVMEIFRRATSPQALHVSMAGVKMGDRFLQLGAGDGRAFATLATKVGLTGRACVVDPDETAAARATAAAAKTGVLVEVSVAPYGTLPFDDESFDLVIAHDLIAGMRPDQRVRTLQQAWRVLRKGGRCVVVEPAIRAGLAGLLSRTSRDADYVSSGGAVPALQAEAFRGARLLAEREGVTFYEGMKGR